jgi:hypothetical protein
LHPSFEGFRLRFGVSRAGWSCFHTRVLPRLAAAIAALVAASAGASATAAAPPLVDRPARLPTAFAPPGFTGGTYTAATGESVRIFSSSAYAADPGFNQRWADFVASLPHGPELSTVTVYLAPLAQVAAVCGQHTIGCYSPEDRVIFASGDDVPERATAQSIVAHEYGHHLANSRDNPPWPSEDYGTKRWATYERVCPKTRAKALFPGDETDHYKLNSGEVFAESYRVYAEQKLGLPSAPWLAVDASLQPDATALQLIGEDVSDPWTGPSVSTVDGGFRSYTGDARTVRFATPLDGVLTVTLRGAAGSSLDARLFDPSGRRLLAETTSGARTLKTVRYVVCGERNFELRVVRRTGYGSFTLQISKP